ncbi:AAA family ATPase [Microbacterium sp.]|uniref:AAA family ATPase n=1 Tax=Microbacterium sp. TaxID=51671 RepID=UPI003F6F65AF
MCNYFTDSHRAAYSEVMRGGLERWKRGAGSGGLKQAVNYAFEGTCDSHFRTSTGVAALDAYANVATVSRFTVTDERIARDALAPAELRAWVDGRDPKTGAERGVIYAAPNSDLVLDGTVNAPKTFSLAALLHPEIGAEFERLQDRLRDRIVRTWQSELNARRGHGGLIREDIAQIEVVELQHRRSRSLDPHLHRHLWLNVKVLGRDGRWSNVDSRVAMKLHTLINAEGDLAARTDPEWIAVLAKHGYTVNADGEIAQLVHAVRPLSRRSNQIELNRSRLLATWRDEHRGAEPSYDVLRQIDRRAWATSRPNKPGTVNEDEWEDAVRAELAQIDRALVHRAAPRPVQAVSMANLDRTLLAEMGVVDADDRSTGSGGRFSRFDVRAGVVRAISRSGVIAPREELDGLIDEVTASAIRTTVKLVDAAGAPGHVKCLMSSETVRAKIRLAGLLDALAQPGGTEPRAVIRRLAARVVGAKTLDDAQVAAARAIAGDDRLVTVTGPAGAGKTTMLRVAHAAVARRGGRMVVVAPTKKAATVAAREIGTSASSIHALLLDHGYRWSRDVAGAQVWSRLTRGEVDPTTGHVYAGPVRFAVGPQDRIVVDEAGMVDLYAAAALAQIAVDTGARIAFVGDPCQALPVGHSGAMAAATRRAATTVELQSVHRFHDREYAELTLRLRNPASDEDALAVAADLDAAGHLHRVASREEALSAMVDGYFAHTGCGDRVALVTGNNADADAINEAIQQRRIDSGDLNLREVAIGQGEQRLLVGDLVQTRRNDRASGVENRASWIIRRITADHIDLISPTDTADLRRITRAYAEEHVHLAYASTVHGIQGETTDASIVGPDVDAAGLYVGLTRGRTHNAAITIADGQQHAIENIARSMRRGTPEVTIEDSIRAARAELARTRGNTPAPMAPVAALIASTRGIA